MRNFIGIAIVLGLTGMMLAGHDGHGKVKIKVLSEKDIAEKIDGKESKAVTVEVTFEPGQSSPPQASRIGQSRWRGDIRGGTEGWDKMKAI